MFGPLSQMTPSPPPPKASAIPHIPERCPQGSLLVTPILPHLATPSLSHSNSVSLAASMSPGTPPDYDDHNAKMVSSMGLNTIQISSDYISPPRYHSIPWKSPSPMITSHHKSHSADVKHSSPIRFWHLTSMCWPSNPTPSMHMLVPAYGSW
jgi:hypothetical protein